MTVDQMRERLAEIYGPHWPMTMGERQVVAIYKSMERNGQFEKRKKKKREPGVYKAKQLSVFDIDYQETKNGIKL